MKALDSIGRLVFNVDLSDSINHLFHHICKQDLKCVCVCVRERERKREREKGERIKIKSAKTKQAVAEKERDRQKQTDRQTNNRKGENR